MLQKGDSWPKISIIIPLYNQAVYIEETIRSALLQDYPNSEIFVINDSSTDGSRAVAAKYLPWITLIDRPRGSQANALNFGFRRAAGDLIAWQNSDDLFGEGSLAAGAIASMNNGNSSIFHGTTKCFWDFNSNGPYEVVVCEEFSEEAFLDRMCIMNQSMLFRRQIFENGHFLREDMRYVFDQEFFWRLSVNGYIFQLVPELIGYFRWHRQSITFSPANIIAADRELFRMQRELLRDVRLRADMRRKLRHKMWNSLFAAFRRCRRNIPYKIVPEMFVPIRSL